jgi:hypothetical protein
MALGIDIHRWVATAPATDVFFPPAGDVARYTVQEAAKGAWPSFVDCVENPSLPEKFQENLLDRIIEFREHIGPAPTVREIHAHNIHVTRSELLSGFFASRGS